MTWLVSELTQRKLTIQAKSVGDSMEELKWMEAEVADPSRVWTMLGDLIIHRQSLMQQIHELQMEEVRKPRFYERLLLRLFEWSIKDRFG